jgi:Zn ribbon nucleic-acid-binding protein
MNTVCQHPKVKVVAREDDVEFVECLDCGEVFDSNEFRDMQIEDLQDEEETA